MVREEARRCLRCDICLRCGKCVEVCRDSMKVNALQMGYLDFTPQQVVNTFRLGITERASAYTPVPGGVGPMTINTLIYQSVESGEKSIAGE